jgi:poly(A) polymerase
MSELESTARSLVQRLRDAGFTALYAGGCVRDMLLEVEPHDYDIATDARPEQVQQLFDRTFAVGAHFGVVVVHREGHDFQIATFRSDGAYIDGRRPTAVTFSSPQTDAERRDRSHNRSPRC